MTEEAPAAAAQLDAAAMEDPGSPAGRERRKHVTPEHAPPATPVRDRSAQLEQAKRQRQGTPDRQTPIDDGWKEVGAAGSGATIPPPPPEPDPKKDPPPVPTGNFFAPLAPNNGGIDDGAIDERNPPLQLFREEAQEHEDPKAPGGSEGAEETGTGTENRTSDEVIGVNEQKTGDGKNADGLVLAEDSGNTGSMKPVASLPGTEKKSNLKQNQGEATWLYNRKKPANCDLDVVVEHTKHYCAIDSSFGKGVMSIVQHAAKRCAEAEEPLVPLSEVEKLVW